MNRASKVLFRKLRLFTATLLVAIALPQISSTRPALADDGGYLWINAVTTGDQYSWGYSPCPSSDTNCMLMTDNGYGTADPWIYGLRNCTSYVAWKINQVFGSTNITGWGNAATWDTGYTESQPYAVHSPSSYTPQIGDIAQWDSGLGHSLGHVAYVYAVNNGIASLDEYNVAGTGEFSNNRTTASSSAGTPDHYIHIGTPSGDPSSTNHYHSDVDGNAASDLVLSAWASGGSTAVFSDLSTFSNFVGPADWLDMPYFGWGGITPLVGDVNHDGKADYVFLSNQGAAGTDAWVSLSTGSGFQSPQLWWQGSGYGYSGIKASIGDVDGNGADDLVLTEQGTGNTATVQVLLSTFQGFNAPTTWLNLPNFSWSGITPLLGDVTHDGKADYVFVTNEGANGIKSYVAPSLTNTGFGAPQYWLNEPNLMYNSLKMNTGDVDGNGADDLVLTNQTTSNATQVFVAQSTFGWFEQPVQWLDLPSSGWTGLTPLVGNADHSNKANYVFVTDESPNGIKVFVAPSNGVSSFQPPQLWLSAPYLGYSGIKMSLR